MEYKKMPRELIKNWFVTKMKLSLNDKELEDLCSKIDDYVKINYTRSCETLNDEKIYTFEEWLIHKKYTKLGNSYTKNGFTFSYKTIIRRYNNWLLNL